MADSTSPKILVRAVTAPAAGAEVSHTVADEDLLLRSIRFKLVTDANVANRRVHITFEDSSGNVYAEYASLVDHAASTTRFYTFNRIPIATPSAVVDNTIQIPLPADGILIPKGGKIKTVTTSIQAGDAYTLVSFSAERL